MIDERLDPPPGLLTRLVARAAAAVLPLNGGQPRLDEIRRLLVQQVLRPVRWEDSIRYLLAEGFDQFYEVGPGRVLRGLLRRIDRKRIRHDEVGLLDFLCETLTGVNGETLVVLYPQPGTDTREKLDLLQVIGSQDLTSAT